MYEGWGSKYVSQQRSQHSQNAIPNCNLSSLKKQKQAVNEL